jgi:hypothetical protein
MLSGTLNSTNGGLVVNHLEKDPETLKALTTIYY